MNTLRKGKTLGSFKVEQLQEKNAWRAVYDVKPARYCPEMETCSYRAIVYDMEVVPGYSLWTPQAGRDDTPLPLEMRFLGKQWTSSFPFAEESSVEGRFPWIVVRDAPLARMEYIIGGDENPFSFEESMNMAIALCGTLELVRYFDFGGEVCHFNVSPFSVLYDPVKDINCHIWLDGFDNMAYAHGGHKVPRLATDSTLYMAPEMFSGDYDERGDVWAVCLLLYRLLMDGDYPWPIPFKMRYGISAGVVANEDYFRYMKGIWEQPLNMGKFLTDSIRDILRKGLSVDPGQRFGTVQELRDALEDSLKSYLELIARIELDEDEDEIEGEKAKEAESLPTPPPDTGFSSLAGMNEFKEMMTDKFILPFKHRDLAEAYGLNLPSGVLLYGPPGNGKTLSVRHLAGEAGIAYKLYSPSDLGSTFIHGSQGKIRDIFDEARKEAPVILAFDEAEALVPDRSLPSSEHYAGETNEFLCQLNDAAKDGVYVFLMTNFPERIDPAVLRRGRVDEMIFIPLPDEASREEFFRIRLVKMKYVGTIDFHGLAVKTEGMTFADLDYIVSEACRRAFRRSVDNPGSEPSKVTMEILEAVVSETGPSVTEAVNRRFEALKERFDNKYRGTARRRIGFPEA